MPDREFHYRWEFNLESSPTNSEGLKNARRRLRLSALGIPVEWEEQPFEWVRPSRFGVVRRYTKGPIAELRVRVELTPTRPEHVSPDPFQTEGTRLVYEL